MTRVRERDIELADGRTLHAYVTGRRRSGRLPIIWHHGTPNTGAPPEPLMRAAKKAGLRWVSFDRPGYGGSSRHEGRTVGSIAADDGIDFTGRDWAALAGEWGWLGTVAAAGVATGLDGPIDDDLAYVAPWRVDLTRITAPTLLAHGVNDRVVPIAHARWLADALPNATLWEVPGEGHISALADDDHGAAAAVRWVANVVGY
ncbi:alpha/beta fold hydrolase [Microcella alkaliphila]|uniref:Uncharacterized protein n=1 Tax=Microcella alkaliphila TaxID=279828 RepID=A0A0U5BKU9_9MICO|nr:alpha/beta hydrolase [Microcella alkaliphila]BAU31212.1 uncharacterized protein MalAC0309_0337 [Microcella alkaliphila]